MSVVMPCYTFVRERNKCEITVDCNLHITGAARASGVYIRIVHHHQSGDARAMSSLSYPTSTWAANGWSLYLAQCSRMPDCDMYVCAHGQGTPTLNVV